MITSIKSSFLEYKMTILRNKKTSNSLFRQTMNEASYLIAAEVLKFLGISCIIAKSFAGIFYRNAINLGLPAFLLPKDSQLPKEFVDGSSVVFDFENSILFLEGSGIQINLDPLPAFLQELINDGGLVPHLEKRFDEK